MDNSFKIAAVPFIGIVTNVNDPEKLGRVQVTAFGYNIRNSDEYNKVVEYTKKNFDSTLSKEKEIPSAYWASVLSPTTSAGISGIGTTHGLRPGSTVFGYYLDGETGQQPAIIGVFNGLTNQLKITQDNTDAREKKLKSDEVLSGDNYELDKTSSVNRLTRNEDIDKTIVEQKKKQIQQSNSAYSLQSHLKDIGKSNNLDAVKAQVKPDALKERFKASIKEDEIKNKLKAQLTSNIANVISPQKILDRTLSKIRDRNAALSDAGVKALTDDIMSAKCQLARMAEGVIDAAMSALAKAVSEQINAAMTEIGVALGVGNVIDEATKLLEEFSDTVANIENEILLAEAEALGAIANVVGGISDIALNIEQNILGAIDQELSGVMGSISGAVDGLISDISELGGSGSSLAKIQEFVSTATESYAAVDSINKNLTSALTDVKSFNLAKVEDFIPEIEDFSNKANSILEAFKLDRTGC